MIAVGLMVAVALPWLVLIIVAVVAIVMLVKRRIAFWVPLVGGVLIIGSWFLGAAIASAGVPGRCSELRATSVKNVQSTRSRPPIASDAWTWMRQPRR